MGDSVAAAEEAGVAAVGDRVLRLDAERHLKLRLASAVTGRSAQQIVCQALDDFLTTLPEIDRLADQLPQARRKMTKGG